MLVFAWMVFPLSISGNLVLQVWHYFNNVPARGKPSRDEINVRARGKPSRDEINVRARRNPSRDEIQSKHTNTNSKTKRDGGRDNDELSNVDHVVTSAKPSNFEAMLYIFLKTMKQWSRWSGQVEVRRWDTCPEPTELYLIGWETSRKTSLLVVWHARTRDKVRGKILWNGEKECWAVVQSLYSVLGRPSLEEGRTGSGRRIVQSMLTNCLEMLVFGQKWTRVPNPQSRTWLVDRINLGPQNPNHVRLIPKTNSQTYWQREISHVMNGTIFSVCLTSWGFPFFLAGIWNQSTNPRSYRRDSKKENQEKKNEWWRNQSQWWIWYRRSQIGLRQTKPWIRWRRRMTCGGT